jgi:hypothetical protein
LYFVSDGSYRQMRCLAPGSSHDLSFVPHIVTEMRSWTIAHLSANACCTNAVRGQL